MSHACILSHFSCIRLFATLWTVCSPPGSSVPGIFQARILEWVAMPRYAMSCHASSRGYSQPKDQTRVSCNSCIAGRFLTTEPLGKFPMSNKARTPFSWSWFSKRSKRCPWDCAPRWTCRWWMTWSLTGKPEGGCTTLFQQCSCFLFAPVKAPLLYYPLVWSGPIRWLLSCFCISPAQSGPASPLYYLHDYLPFLKWKLFYFKSF